MWGWGAMNPTAVKEAAKINFPMSKFCRRLVVGVRRMTHGRPAADAKGLFGAELQRRGVETIRRSRTS